MSGQIAGKVDAAAIQELAVRCERDENGRVAVLGDADSHLPHCALFCHGAPPWSMEPHSGRPAKPVPQRPPAYIRFNLLQSTGRKLQTEMNTVNKLLLSRREFNARCVAVGMSLPAASAMLAAAPTAGAAAREAPTVRFPDGSVVPAVG